jgi:hypothetical protein
VTDYQSPTSAPHFLSPKEFCQRNSLCLTSLYKLLKEGRLHAQKVGRRTIIGVAEEERWRSSLPAYQPNGR